MKRSRALVAGLVCLGVCLTVPSGEATAQDREADAERLFREGQKLLEARRYGEACPKFELAYQKDGQLGTLLNLAFCHKEQGAKWYAWLEFREAEIKATELDRPDRRDFAKQQLPALEKSLAMLVVDNPEGTPLASVFVEDRKVPAAESGAPFAAEPGARKITFHGKRGETGTLLVDVVKGEQPMHVTVPELAAPAADTVPTAKADPERTYASVPAARAETPSTMPAQKTLALGALGVAAISGVVMGVTGLMTLTNDCASGGDRDNCKDDAAGRAESERGKTTATIATVTGVISGLALTGGLVLWLTAPKSKDARADAATVRVRPELGLGWAGVRGRF